MVAVDTSDFPDQLQRREGNASALQSWQCH